MTHLAPPDEGGHVSATSLRAFMSRLLLALLLVAAACTNPSAPPSPLPDAARLRDTLVAQFDRSADAWNRGDLDAFVGDYAKDSLTEFVSRGHVHRGYDWIRRNYAPRFAEGAQRDSLRFEEFAVRPLAPAVALVTARYVLFRDGRIMASGPFTLILERRADGWKILHDHTSSD